MGKIKSALELALERTESVSGGKESIALFQAKQKGKKLANEFLSGSITSFETALRDEDDKARQNLKQGIFDVLISRITLPATKDDSESLERAGNGLCLIIGNKVFNDLMKQFRQLMTQFLDEAAEYQKAIIAQYEPKLRQKEEEIARRYGQRIKIEPMQDPEFAAFFNQHMNALKGNYQSVVDQVREQAAQYFQGNV